MRMWNVDPELMCRKHLLGEHVEMHMFVGTINKGNSIKGYTETGLVDVAFIERRHDQLAREMILRGYNHQSPLPKIENEMCSGFVDSESSLKELARRCGECQDLQERMLA